MARPEVRGLIIPEVFRDGMFGDERFRLATCFQTMEHVPDPLALARSVRVTLKPGGAFMVVVHDRRFWLNRVLGRRSPIMDIEHLQLFCPQSLTRLLRHAGYRAVEVRPVTNAYPLEYWVRLLPLPRPVKALVQWVLGPLRKRMVRVSVGNLMGVGSV
jgi:SAM-dependent methyltransferase